MTATLAAVTAVTAESGIAPVPVAISSIGIAVAVFGATRMRAATPELVIDSHGVVIRLIGRIHWTEIDRVRVRTIDVGPKVLASRRLNTNLEIVLADPVSVISRMDRRARLLTALSPVAGWSRASVTASQVLPHTINDVIHDMRLYHPALRVET
ncbi:hypothetical protein ACFVVM_17005 [Nocardia sp. NPDC058176]|uniref:hypothetical protein n=1 Tax=Nocardia sp. NPDC058176 TaxID=3346368 RepID=UPI0036D84269